MSSLTFLNVPGFTGSGPHHWQSLWEKHFDNFYRVQQRDWEHPDCSEWVEELDYCIAQYPARIIQIRLSYQTVKLNKVKEGQLSPLNYTNKV